MQFYRYCSQLICPYLQWMDVTITQSWVKQTALKDTYWSTTIIDAIGMTWYQVGTASKEQPEIGWRTNVFPKITAAPSLQAGLMANTRQSQKVWSLVESVIIITCQTTAVSGVTIYRSGTVGLSSYMSCKRRLLVLFVTVETGAEVICLVSHLTFRIWVVSYPSDRNSYWYHK